MDKRRNMGNWYWYMRALVKALLLIGFIGVLWAELLTSGGTKTTTTTLTTPRRENINHLDVLGRDKPILHPYLDPNYMSKRRVPKGPDPIHNRKAGIHKQPPNKA